MAENLEQETIKKAVGGKSEKSEDNEESGKEEVFVPSPGSRKMFGESNAKEIGTANDGMRPSIMEGGEENLMQNAQMQGHAQEQGQGDPREFGGMPADYNQQSYDYGQAQQEYLNQGQQTQDYTQQYAQEQGQQDLGQYQPYQEIMSSDVITEISEQVVDDKLFGLRDKMEKAINFGTLAEARIASIDKRLKRIEQIIDTLQISLLQRVSEYVTDIKDIKNEIEETHKTMKAGHHVHHSQGGEHHHTEHPEHHSGHSQTHQSHMGTAHHHVAHPRHKGKKHTP